MKDNINVAIRVRPLNEKEENIYNLNVSSLSWAICENSIFQASKNDSKSYQGATYTFDKVYDQNSKTEQIYNGVVKDIVKSAMNGINGTAFAYGQTSSGKTHTMYGNDSEPGIIRLAVRDLFEHIYKNPQRQYIVRLSYLEIYNEVISDLLDPNRKNLKISENLKREVFVRDSSEHVVFTIEEVETLLQKGEKNRHIGCTNMNERSSRSHTIARLVIESGDNRGNEVAHGKRLSEASMDDNVLSGAVKVSALSLVDLAGSERVGHTGAEGLRLREGAHINKSLLALGSVIARLSESGVDRGHIPYRDSKLTRMLQSSLGGNSRTVIICTITLSDQFFDETNSTLKFANRAKTITNQPEINEELRGEELLRRLKKVNMLEKEIAEMQKVVAAKENVSDQNRKLLLELNWSEKSRIKVEHENGLLREELARIKDKIKATGQVLHKESQTLDISDFKESVEYEKLCSDLDGYLTQVKIQQNSIETLKHEQNTLNSENYKLKYKLQDVLSLHKLEVSDLSDQVLRLENEKLATISENEKIRSNMSNSNLLLAEQLNLAKNDINELTASYETKFTKLLDELDIQRGENCKLSECSKQFQQKAADLQNILQKQKDNYERDINDIRQAHSTKLTEISLYNDSAKMILVRNLEELENDYSKLKHQKDIEYNLFEKLKSDYDHALAESSILKEKMQKSKDTFEGKEKKLKTQIESLSSSGSELQSSIEKLLDDEKKQSLQYQALRREYSQVKGELTLKLEQQAAQIENLKFSNSKTSEENNKEVMSLKNELSGTIASYEQRVNQLENKCQSESLAHISKVEELETRLEAIRNDSKQLVDSISASHEAERTSLIGQMNSLREQKSLKDSEHEHFEKELRAHCNELEKKNQSCLSDLEFLNGVIEDLRNKSSTFQQQINNRNISISNLENLNIALNHKINKKSEEIDELTSKLELLGSELHKLDQSYTDLKQINELTANEISALDQEDERLLSEIGKHIEDLHKKSSDYCTLSEKYCSDLELSGQKTLLLEEKINTITENFSSEKTKLQSEYQLEINRILQSLHKVEAKYTSLVTQSNNMQLEFEKTRSVLDSLGADYQVNLEKVKALELELEQKKVDNKQAGDDVAAYQTRCSALETKVSELNQIILETTKSHADSTSEHSNALELLHKEIKLRVSELDTAVKERNEGFEMIEKAKSMMVELVKIKDTEIETLENSLGNEIATLKNENSELIGKLAQSQGEASSKESDLKNQLKEQFLVTQNLQNQQNSVKAQLESSKNENAVMETSIAKLEEFKALAEINIDNLETQVKEKESCILKLESAIREEKDAVASLKKDLSINLEELSKGFDLKTQEYNLNIKQLESQLEGLTCDLLVANQSLDKAEDISIQTKSIYQEKLTKLKEDLHMQISELKVEIDLKSHDILLKEGEIKSMLELDQSHSEIIERGQLKIKGLLEQADNILKNQILLLEFLQTPLLEFLRDLYEALRMISSRFLSKATPHGTITDNVEFSESIFDSMFASYASNVATILAKNTSNRLSEPQIEAIEVCDIGLLKTPFNYVTNYLKFIYKAIYPKLEFYESLSSGSNITVIEITEKNNQLSNENKQYRENIERKQEKIEELQRKLDNVSDEVERFKTLNKNIERQSTEELEMHNRKIEEMTGYYRNLIDETEESFKLNISALKAVIDEKSRNLESVKLEVAELTKKHVPLKDKAVQVVFSDMTKPNNPEGLSKTRSCENNKNENIAWYQLKIDELSKQKLDLEKALKLLSSDALNGNPCLASSSQKNLATKSNTSDMLHTNLELANKAENLGNTRCTVSNSSYDSRKESDSINALTNAPKTATNHVKNDLLPGKNDIKKIKKRTRRYVDSEAATAAKKVLSQNTDNIGLGDIVGTNKKIKNEAAPITETDATAPKSSQDVSRPKLNNPRRKRYTDNDDYSPECAQQ